MELARWIDFGAGLLFLVPLLAIGAVLWIAVLSWRQAGSRGVVRVLAGGFIGMVAGNFLGALVACEWLWPASNLCGMGALFTTAPLAAIAGALIGRRTASRPPAPQ